MGYGRSLSKATLVAGAMFLGTLTAEHVVDMPFTKRIADSYPGHVLQLSPDQLKEYFGDIAYAVPPTPTPSGGPVGGIAELSPYASQNQITQASETDQGIDNAVIVFPLPDSPSTDTCWLGR